MNPLIQCKRTILPVLIASVLASFGLLSKAQAVVPAPDGGYPGGNTAEGTNALLSLTSGTYNTAIGLFSLLSNTEGNFNTALGAGTLLLNAADQNTATGAAALLSNTTGFANTASGAFALFSNTEGFQNTANGVGALFSNVSGNYNTAIGLGALRSSTASDNNTAIGINTLLFNTIGGANTACGANALLNNTTGGVNTATGVNALLNNTTGANNTAIGEGALAFNTTGTWNTASGTAALFGNTAGDSNTALGYSAGTKVTTASHVICIGANVVGENVSNSCYIGEIFGATSSGGSAVIINSDGRLGTNTSSRRFKEQVKPMERASEVLFALKPVTFRYKKDIDPAGISQFGLVAEEVEKVNPDLVVRDQEGKPHSVRCDAVNAMLLNEFLKEHRKVEKLEAALDAVNERLKEQAAQIQKVTHGSR